MNKTKSQSGFAHLAIVIILAVALVGALGFIYWQNFMQPKAETSKTDSSKTSDTSSDKTPASTPTDTNKGFLVLSDWGVKFKLPANLGSNTVTYSKTSQDNYGFTTSGIVAIGGDCNPDTTTMTTAYQFFLHRQTTPQSTEVASGGYLLKQLGSYYYYLNSAQGGCTENNTTLVADRSMLQTVLESIEKE